MDLNEDPLFKRCFKCDQQVLGSLNIACDASNSMTILWNRHQIFVYSELKFDSTTRNIEPEFQIFDLLLFNNHIACLDFSGNIHVISLKFKSTKKRLRSCFHPRKQNILACAQYNMDVILTLQSIDSLYLSLHQVNREFQLEKKFNLIFEKEQSAHIRIDQKCILKCLFVSENKLECVKQLFNGKVGTNNNNMIIISFDKLVVYTCLISSSMSEDEINLIKLYSCPSEICDIQIVENEFKIVIGLTIGSIIVISLLDTEKKPVIIHLNTAIYKFFLYEDIVIYTDGCTIWKTENIFTKELDFNQLFVKQVKDFIKINDNIICTTFSHLIYVFNNDEKAYVKVSDEEDVDYSPAEKLLTKMEYFNQFLYEFKKNEDLVAKLNKEEDYITALSLSNRQDIMNDVINIKVVVYESYEDAVKEYTPITLTEAIEEYFKPESTFFLLNIVVNTGHRIFNSVLQNLFTDMKIHINFSTNCKLLKTTSVKTGDQFDKTNYLIPLKVTSSQININIVYVMNMPGVYDKKHTHWNTLYTKNVLLNSEHFIKTNNLSDKVLHLKKSIECEELILQINLNDFGDLFKFTDVSNATTQEWCLYVKLPKYYSTVLKNSDHCELNLNFKSSDVLTRLYTSEEFLKSKNAFVIMVGDEKVKLEVVNDGFSDPVLRISSGNLKIASDIRNFFADMIYNFHNYVYRDSFISHTFYTTVENIQKAVRTCITKGCEPEEIISIAERFERNVIGALPM